MSLPTDPPAHDDARRLLELSARLHSARGDLDAWLEAVEDCRAWFGCTDALDPGERPPGGPDDIAGFAERVEQCASAGAGACGGDALKRCRCGALAPHLAASATALRDALRATAFEQGGARWILGRDGSVHAANGAARTLAATGDPLRIEGGRLVPAHGLAQTRLQGVLATIERETIFAWPHAPEREIALRLRPAGDTIHATLVQDGVDLGAAARRLAALLALPPRQAELAAHLVHGASVAGAARAMTISRDTANEHLLALRKRTGSADRATLVALLRRSLAG